MQNISKQISTPMQVVEKPVRLNTCLYQFNFKAIDTIYFRTFSASAWRGLFGMSLRQTVCVTGLSDCKQCMLSSSCAYVYLFETRPPVDSDRMRRYSTIPHPFVIKNTPSAQSFKSTEFFHLDILLFGKGQEYLPYIIQTLIRAGKNGLNRERSQFSLESVSCQTNLKTRQWQTIWTQGQTNITKVHVAALKPASFATDKLIKIQFKTPFRFIRQGKLVRHNKIEFHHLYRSLSRRISMLAYFHDHKDLQLDYKSNIEKAESVKIISKKLYWEDWERYSARQKSSMKMGGVVGDMVIDLNAYPQLWELLWLGQYTHAGKASSMGLGEFTLQLLDNDLASLPAQQKSQTYRKVNSNATG